MQGIFNRYLSRELNNLQ